MLKGLQRRFRCAKPTNPTIFYWPLQKIMPIGRNVSCLSQHLGHVEVRVFAMPPGLPFIAIGLVLLAVGLVATYLESTGGK